MQPEEEMTKAAVTTLVIVATIASVRCGRQAAQPGSRSPAANTVVVEDTGLVPGVPYVEVGQTYRVRVGVELMSVQVVSIRNDGMAVVVALNRDASSAITEGSLWWLNLKQVQLLEQKNSSRGRQ